MTARQSVLVAGGGVAGIASALALSQLGVPVTLVETRKKLGGRATSFTDVRTGEHLDNCQHVVLGCCTNYLDFLRRLSALEKLTWTREQYWIERGGRTSIIRPSFLPAPTHFSLSVLAARFLSLNEKLALARAMNAILRADRSRWINKTFADFLASVGQPPRLIRVFWAPVVISACNLPCERCCASSALQVFQEGFIANAHAADVGVSRVPLVELYDRAESIITAAGGSIRLGTSIQSLTPRSITLNTGEVLHADKVISTLPAERLREVLSDELITSDPRLTAATHVSHSPILGVHMRFDRPILTTPHAVLVDAGVQWLFRKDDEGTSIHAVISAADDWLQLTEDQVAQRVLSDLHAHIPSSIGAKLLWVRPVKEKRATFALTPDFEPLRPAVIPSSPDGLILAGDWVQSGWPATMEGAVRTGYAAAAAALGRPAGELVVRDMPPSRLCRLLGLKQVPSPLLQSSPPDRTPPAHRTQATPLPSTPALTS